MLNRQPRYGSIGDAEDWARPKGHRLPKNGKWSGQPGHSDFISDNPADLGLQPGEVIPFRYGRPDFSKWARETHSVPALTGVHNTDQSLIWEHLAGVKGWLKSDGTPNAKAAREWLSREGLAAHHAGGDTVQLIPLKLHDGIRHMGAAFDLRN